MAIGRAIPKEKRSLLRSPDRSKIFDSRCEEAPERWPRYLFCALHFEARAMSSVAAHHLSARPAVARRATLSRRNRGDLFTVCIVGSGLPAVAAADTE